jgi:hypothetical protein
VRIRVNITTETAASLNNPRVSLSCYTVFLYYAFLVDFLRKSAQKVVSKWPTRISMAFSPVLFSHLTTIDLYCGESVQVRFFIVFLTYSIGYCG